MRNFSQIWRRISDPSPASDSQTKAPNGVDLRSSRLVIRLWRDHVLKYWPALTFPLILMSLEGAALGAFAWMVRPLFDELFSAQSLDGLWKVVTVIGFLFLFRAVVGFVQRVKTARPFANDCALR